MSTMDTVATDTVNPLDLVFSNDASQTEVLSYLSLRQVQRLRSVSTRWRSHCEDYKRLFLLLLKTLPTKVLILELQSDKGKLLNGRIGTIQGQPTKEGRFPVGLTNWLTGEVESVTFKPCNLHPFFYQKEDIMDHPEERLLSYTSSSKLLRSHGMMLHQILSLARFECNRIKGSPFDGPYEEFRNLPSTHPFITQMNSAIFTWWTTRPSLANLPGLQGPILDVVTTQSLMLMDHNDTKQCAQEDKPWPQDGPQGVDMARNFVQFMKAWDIERVTAGFWVERVYSTGTIMVQVDDPEDPTSLGQVYLVKGHASIIGKDILRSLPSFCTTTLLPIYDCWTYDGLVRGRTFPDLAPDFAQRLHAHVDQAIHSKNVSWRGPSAEAGQWATTSPFPTIVQDTEESIVVNWNGPDENANPNTTTNNQEEITPKHWEIGHEIAQIAFDRGGIDNSSDDTCLLVRRFGYSHQENPTGMCAVLYVQEGDSSTLGYHFQFQVGDDPSQIPTYTLEEALQAIIDFFRNQIALPFAAVLHPDELSVVLPMETVLTQCFQEKGMEAPFVGWFPPPTTEEKILDTLRSRAALQM